LAFAINKQVGNAVVRNRIRRRLREVARHRLALPAGLYLVRAKHEAASLGFEDLANHLVRAVTSLMGTVAVMSPVEPTMKSQAPAP
jgi:ribonuclease P protein component